MASNRYTCLAVRAHSQGRLDYGELNHKDPLWIAKEFLILDELEREAWKEFDAVGRQMLSILVSAQANQETQSNLTQLTTDELNRAGRALIPWGSWAVTKEEKAKARIDRAKTARVQWEKAYGSISSAKVQEAERHARMYLLSTAFTKRARNENRKFTDQQARFISDARSAQTGDRSAWRRISAMSAKGIMELFSSTLHVNAVKADIRDELGEVL